MQCHRRIGYPTRCRRVAVVDRGDDEYGPDVQRLLHPEQSIADAQAQWPELIVAVQAELDVGLAVRMYEDNSTQLRRWADVTR